MSHNLYALLTSRFPKRSDTLFIEIPHGRSISYSQVDQLAARFAGALQHLGLAPGERMLMSIEKSPETILLYLAVLRLGAILVPLNPAYTTREFKFFLNDAQPKVVILDPNDKSGKQTAAEESGAKVVTLDAFNAGSIIAIANTVDACNQIIEVSKDTPAAILYTSGTTGQPKGAVLTHGNLASNGITLQRIWGFQPEDVLLHVLPVFHVHGLFVAVHCAMLSGSKILYLPKFEVNLVTKHICRATVMMGVPTFYIRLIEHASFDAASCINMRLFISGSAPLLPQTWIAFKRKTKHEILERYGMSEAGMIASNPLGGDRIPGTVGFQLPEISVRISGRNGEEISFGEIGMLEVKGPNVFPGYWESPHLNDSEFRGDGFFISGDMAIMNKDRRITIIGRDRDLVISGGLNIYPKEIEDCLNQFPGIIESAVIGIPHPDFGEALLALIVPDSKQNLDERTIINSLKTELAGFKVPRHIIFISALPRNVMGKVQKNILRETYSDELKR